MVVRDTSIKALQEAKDTGIITGQQGIAFDLLLRHGPATQREIEQIYLEEVGEEQWNTRLQKRFSELERLGLIKPVGKRACTVTGKTAYVWAADPENRLEAFPRPETKDEIIKRLEAQVQSLTGEIRALQARLAPAAEGQRARPVIQFDD
jgi:hypothetical protein